MANVPVVDVPFIRSPYNYDRDMASEESGLFCPEASRTKQAFAEECDINTIVRRFGLMGEMPVNVRMPTYGDFTGVYDFHSAMNAVALARESFGRMPAEVRARFHNSPQEFVEFVNDEGNRDEAVKLGLVLPKAVEAAAGLVSSSPGAPAAPAGSVAPAVPAGGPTPPNGGGAQ